MGKKLYVGNLPYSAGEAELRELFSKVGTAETITIVTDRDTGRPRGFAFVEMATETETARAIADLDGLEMGGRRLSVNEARPKADSNGFERRRTDLRW